MERRRSRVEQLRQRNDDPLVTQQTRRLAAAALGSDNNASSDSLTSTLPGRKDASTPPPVAKT